MPEEAIVLSSRFSVWREARRLDSENRELGTENCPSRVHLFSDDDNYDGVPPNMPAVSVASTVLNESDDIDALVESLMRQRLAPAEVIIVFGLQFFAHHEVGPGYQRLGTEK